MYSKGIIWAFLLFGALYASAENADINPEENEDQIAPDTAENWEESPEDFEDESVPMSPEESENEELPAFSDDDLAEYEKSAADSKSI